MYPIILNIWDLLVEVNLGMLTSLGEGKFSIQTWSIDLVSNPANGGEVRLKKKQTLFVA